jgi:hypothetical protein
MSFLSDYFIDLYYYSEYGGFASYLAVSQPVVQYMLGDCDLRNSSQFWNTSYSDLNPNFILLFDHQY